LRYGVLNFLAMLILILLAFENYETWTHAVEAIPEKETSGKSSPKIQNPLPVVGEKESTSIQSYISIAEKNIFSPERKEFPAQASPEVKKPVARPQIILYGVMIADEYQSASVANPGRPLQKGEKETMSLKVGERIGEYKLGKILPDRIMMKGPEDSFEVFLYDPNMPKKRMAMKTEVKPAAIASTQPAVPPPAPGSPVPAPLPSSASAEAAKPVEPVQEKVATSPPTPRVTRSAFPSPESRGRRILYPARGIPPQAPRAN